MQQDNQQNYWQPGENPSQQASAQPEPANQEAAQAVVSPHKETFQPSSDASSDDSLVSWEASEYIHHNRSPFWYIALVVIGFGLAALAFFVLNSWTFAILLVVMTIAALVYSRRPPQVLRYTISSKGLHIGQKFHAFGEFKAFGVLQTGSFFSVRLIPTKRFAPLTEVYFAEQDGEKIVDILGHYLPMRQIEPDFADKLSHNIRL